MLRVLVPILLFTFLSLAFGKGSVAALNYELSDEKFQDAKVGSQTLGQIPPTAGTGFRTSLDTDSSGQITAGELWQFFNEQGLTSVDRLTLSVDQSGELTVENLGSVRFQIEDPGTGSYLTNIRVNGSNKLEIPLDYDYMKRFSANSQELIRLEIPRDGAHPTAAAISIEAESPILTKLNLILFSGFIGFWLILFYLLNRFTKPLEEASEDIIVRSSNTLEIAATQPNHSLEAQADRKAKNIAISPIKETPVKSGSVGTGVYTAR